MTLLPSCDMIHNGAAATSSSKAIVCVPSPTAKTCDDNGAADCEIIYASHAMLNVARRTSATLYVPTNDGADETADETSTPVQETIWSVYQSMRTKTTAPTTTTNTTSAAAGTTKRVITSIARMQKSTTSEGEEENATSAASAQVLVAAFSDGSLTFFVFLTTAVCLMILFAMIRRNTVLFQNRFFEVG